MTVKVVTGGVDLSQTPSLEELAASAFDNRTLAASSKLAVLTAPFPLRVPACYLVQMSGSVANSDSNYWSIALRKWPVLAPSSPVTIATKTTQTTGGESISALTDWSFDAATFDATNKDAVKGDVIGFEMTRTGTPSDLVLVTYTVRYEPL